MRKHEMNIVRKTLMVAVVALASNGALAAPAQEEQDFPRLRTQLGLCEDIAWSTEMLDRHPGLIDACREVVESEGRKWARFEAKFVRVNADGLVQFSVRDHRDRGREEVLLRVQPGQVAYMDGKPVRFERLRTSDTINLYMPENEYGFATDPGQSPLAAIVVPPTSTAVEPTTVAAVTPIATRLPATAGPLPGIALSGIVLLLAGMVLTLRRYSARLAKI
jgi:hypothetical protein